MPTIYTSTRELMLQSDAFCSIEFVSKVFKAYFRQLLAQSSEVLQDSSFHENYMNSSKRGYVTWLSPSILHSFHLALAWIGSKMLWLQYPWVKIAVYSLLQFCNKQLHKKNVNETRCSWTFTPLSHDWGLLRVGRLSSPCKTQMLQSRPDAKAKGHTKPSEVDDEYLRTCVQRLLQVERFERLKLCLKRRAKKDFA